MNESKIKGLGYKITAITLVLYMVALVSAYISGTMWARFHVGVLFGMVAGFLLIGFFMGMSAITKIRLQPLILENQALKAKAERSNADIGE